MSDKLTTAQMVAKVMGAIGGLVADKTNSFDNYAYISADNVLTRANAEMAKVGLAVVPSVVDDEYLDIGSNGKRLWFARAVMQMKLIGGSDESEQPLYPWVGYGTDYKLPDKALYKAQTSGHKYFMMKLFNIGVDNTDSEHDEPKDDKQKQTTQKQKHPQQKQQSPVKQQAKPSQPVQVQTKQQPAPVTQKQTTQPTPAPKHPEPQQQTITPREYLQNANPLTYGEVAFALTMTSKYENQGFAMDMINTYPNFAASWYHEDGELKGKLKGEIKADKTLSLDSALPLFDWCVNNSGVNNETS